MKRLLKISAAVAAAACTRVALAAISYSYENDNKTLVVTVDSGTSWLQNDQYQTALNNNTVTNLVKRGAGVFGVNGTAQKFTGDVRIEDGQIQMQGTNPLGTSGRIYVPNGKSVVFSKATVGKDIVTESSGDIYVWAGDSIINGKMLMGNHIKNNQVNLRAYVGAYMTFNGGVEDLDTGGTVHFKPSSGATFVFNSPYNSTKEFRVKPEVTASYQPDNQGFAGHFVFSAARNQMSSFGHDNTTDGGDCRLNWCEIRTTVDWAFDTRPSDGKNMTMYIGHDSVLDLYGTEQRFGQLGVKVSEGNPSVVTNSLATPATLHMGMMYGPSSSAANIRFGGNLSVVFENNIYTTKIDYPMTAAGDLTIMGNGSSTSTLDFLANGSWTNAKNVTVNGNGKIKIANPNALGKRANVNLKSNSSLEIASGVTVQVRTLTVGGVQKPNGYYTFGSGTLRVFRPGTVVSIH